MDASFPSGRSSRKRAISATPSLDGLENRQLLSHVTPHLHAKVVHHRPATHHHAKVHPKKHTPAALGFNLIPTGGAFATSTPTPTPTPTTATTATGTAAPVTPPPAPNPVSPSVSKTIPQAPSISPSVNISANYTNAGISALDLVNFSPIVRVLGGGKIGIRIWQPTVPSNILPQPIPSTPPTSYTFSSPTSVVTNSNTTTSTTPTTTTASTTTPTTTAPTTGSTTTTSNTSSGTSTSSTPTSSTTTTLDAKLQAAMSQLKTDMQAIYDKSQVTPAMLASLRNDYQAINKAATGAATPIAIGALKADFAAVGDSLPNDAQMAQIKADVQALVASRGVTDPTLADKAFADAQTVLNASNFTAADMTTIAADTKAISDALQAEVIALATASSTGSSTASTTAPALPRAMESLLTGLFGPLLGLTTPDAITSNPGPVFGDPTSNVPALASLGVSGTSSSLTQSNSSDTSTGSSGSYSPTLV